MAAESTGGRTRTHKKRPAQESIDELRTSLSELDEEEVQKMTTTTTTTKNKKKDAANVKPMFGLKGEYAMIFCNNAVLKSIDAMMIPLPIPREQIEYLKGFSKMKDVRNIFDVVSPEWGGYANIPDRDPTGVIKQYFAPIFCYKAPDDANLILPAGVEIISVSGMCLQPTDIVVAIAINIDS
jgi:hypothetical protein